MPRNENATGFPSWRFLCVGQVPSDRQCDIRGSDQTVRSKIGDTAQGNAEIVGGQATLYSGI